MEVPFSPPYIGEEEIAEVVDTLRSGWITTGPKTKKFEKMLTEYCKTSKTVCLNSATSALELTLRILGVKPGDEVITTAYTYTASASVVCHIGAKLVLVDCAKDDYLIDYSALENAITEKTKVIIPVDIAGVPCDYNKIFDIVNRKSALFHPENCLQSKFNRIIVVADGAHSLGAVYKNKPACTYPDFCTFSFHAVKNLTTGEGGAVTWHDIENVDSEQLYKQFQLYSLHGQDKDALAKTQKGSWEYDIFAPLYKCNMTDIMASIGIHQLERYNSNIARRLEIIEKYNKALSKYDVIPHKHKSKNYISDGHLYLLRFKNKGTHYRNEFIKRMAEYGVVCNVHYKPLPLHTAYIAYGFSAADYPNAVNIYENEISLPLFTAITDEQVDYVIDTFGKVWEEMKQK